MDTNRLQEIRRDIKEAKNSSDYVAVELLWVALIKAAHTVSGNNEHERILSLVDDIPVRKIKEILFHPAVDILLNLNPPLETVLTNVHERLDYDKTVKAITKVRDFRKSNPQVALGNLGEILKRIRNKREHGFKAVGRPRDREILEAARKILFELCTAIIEI
ncbi:MAG: hypothetical protein ACTSQI_21645 [Candidatus Helarchaeota archaeon]